MSKMSKLFILVVLVLVLVGGAFLLQGKGDSLTGFMRLKGEAQKPTIEASKTLVVAPVRFQYLASTATVNKTPGASDQGEFSITFKATASESDMRLGVDGLKYKVTGGRRSIVPDIDLSPSSLNSGDADKSFVLKKGISRTFTLSAFVTPDVSGSYGFNITSMTYGPETGLEFTSGPNMGAFKTDSVDLTYVP